MRLTTYERKLLANYIIQSLEVRIDILSAAMRDPKESGPLIAAYRTIDTII